ncbi:MAG TPA: MTH895/ArsE family thioredoxin-like protein [Anaerolineae bacterium]|nr:MTH895/ArsE family thioredoxin-like protein [Anaerolineae bacterium]
MQIRIVGAGCPACRQLEEDVRAWIARHRIEAQIERVDDLIAILDYRQLALPGLIVDDRIVLTGYPPRHRLEKALRDIIGEGT